MRKGSTVKETLEAIATTKAFDKLKPFRNRRRWSSMSEQERELLALLFLIQGEQQLNQGDQQVAETFSLATDAAPQSVTAMVYFRQAQAYAAHTKNTHCLEMAHKALEQTAAQDPNLFEVWYLWGTVLTHLGLLLKEKDYLLEAVERYQRAFNLCEADDIRLDARFFWHWGECWYAIGQHLGEACDFRRACDYLHEAVQRAGDSVEVWFDYANALADLAFLVGNQDLFLEAICWYEKAVEHEPQFTIAWTHLAGACTYLYQQSREHYFFTRAEEAFEKATTQNPDLSKAWFRWGQLLAISGKIHKDTYKLRVAIEKIERARLIDPNDLQILATLAEVQMMLGAYLERLDLLREAQAKIAIVLRQEPQEPRFWWLQGNCLNELGQYFGDDSYYLEAIEQFHRGMAVNAKEPQLWYGLAQAHFAIGDKNKDPQHLDTSTRCFAQTLEHEGEALPYFYNDWGVALMRLGEITNEQRYVELAVEKFELALLNKNHQKELQRDDAEWLYNYGCALDFLGDFTGDPQHYEKAIQTLAQVLMLDADFFYARYNFALALIHLGELTSEVDCFQRACELLQTIVEQDPEDELAWNEWGLALMNLSQLMREPARPEFSMTLLTQAEERLLQAVALGCPTAFYNLACLYSLLGNDQASLYFLDRAEQAGSLPPLEEVMQDEWLEFLRQTEDFRQFLHYLSCRERNTQ